MRIKSFGLLCVLMLVSQMLLANCERHRERKKGRQGIKDGGKTPTASTQGNEKVQKSKGGGKSSPRGKFETKENAECTWAVADMNAATLHVECKQGDNKFWCEFSGDPSSCAQYAANQKTYWKQVSRSLKKQKQICQDPKSVLKSKVCRKGPQSAHLRLTHSSLLTAVGADKGNTKHHAQEVVLTPAAASVPEKTPEQSPQDCVEDVDYIDQRKVAEEYCPESLLSFCNFFITMVQDKRC